MSDISLSSHLLRWTEPKFNVILVETEQEEGYKNTISLLGGKTCVFKGDISSDHPAVTEAKEQLSKWAEDLRVSLGAEAFSTAAHAANAPFLRFIPARSLYRPDDPNSSLSISVVYRKCVYKMTIVSDEDVLEIPEGNV